MKLPRRRPGSRWSFTETTVLAFAVLGAGNCPGADLAGETVDQTFARLRDAYFIEVLERNPVTSTYLGGDGYAPQLASVNNRLRDYRPDALAAEVNSYQAMLESLRQIDPHQLSRVHQTDCRVMTAQLSFMVHQVSDLRLHERAIETYVVEPVNAIIYLIQQMTPGDGSQLGTEPEWQQVANRIQAVPEYLAVAQTNLLTGKQLGNLPDRRMVQRDGIDGSAGAAAFYRKDLLDMAQGFLGTQPFAERIMTLLRDEGQKAAAAFDGFAAFNQQTYDVAEAVDRYAVGTAEYEWRVHNNYALDSSAAYLYEYGANEVTKYETQMFQVAEELSQKHNLGLAFGTDDEKRASTRQVLAFLDQDAPANDTELLDWYRQICADSVAYGRVQNLFDIPAEYRLDIVETPTVLRSSLFAAYNPGPVFKAAGAGQFYVTPTGNDPATLALSSRGTMIVTAVHEAFPGHDWAAKFQGKNVNQISNIRWLTVGAVQDTSSMWSDSMGCEAWAHYCEQLMAQPVPGSPWGFYAQETYLYYLRWALFRAARVRLDVGLHTGWLGYDAAVDYFTAHYGFYPRARDDAATNAIASAIFAQADREIFRYTKWPTQAIAYNLGKRLLLELREAYRAVAGNQYSDRRFHEKFLLGGTIAPKFFWDELLETLSIRGWVSEGSFWVGFPSETNQDYRVECSTDLNSWETLIAEMPGNGIELQVKDARAVSTQTIRFYRAVRLTGNGNP